MFMTSYPVFVAIEAISSFGYHICQLHMMLPSASPAAISALPGLSAASNTIYPSSSATEAIIPGSVCHTRNADAGSRGAASEPSVAMPLPRTAALNL